MPSAADYGGIIAGIVTVLKADATLTNQLASYTPAGGTASQANSIFSGEPPKGRAFPCVSLWDLTTGPANKNMQDMPFWYAGMNLQIDCWGASDLVRPIGWRIDNLLAPAYRGGVMDTTAWQFDIIQTSGDWRLIRVPQEWLDGSEALWQYTKVFKVKAASKS